LTFDLDI